MKAALGALLLVIVSACGGGNGSPSPSPDPSPPPAAADPCAAVRLQDVQPDAAPPSPAKIRGMDPPPQWRVLNALWIHRQARDRRPAPLEPAPRGATSIDVGDVAVLRDEGDLILPANAFDLKAMGLRFSRNAAGGYDVRQAEAGFRPTLGNRLTLADDDSASAAVPFAFPFYGATETAAFVNSDGNITFRQGDNASTERDVARLLTGAPRVALFLADLDPSTAGGVFVHAAADQYTVTWCSVRGFESTSSTTAQATLLPDGTIEMKFAAGITLADAVVGLSPGETTAFRPADLSAPGPTGGGAAAVGERFASSPDLDAAAVSKAFYQSHPDAYDQLVIWTDTPVVDDAFAFEVTVANAIQGIGVDLFDFSGDFGSGGVLQSYAVMDTLEKYPADPAQRVLGENSTLSVVAHEVGHRWLAYVDFRDHTGAGSDALLGRQRAHWSFFMDSDASVMEGNDIEDLGGGAFRTSAAVRRYSRLDQYAMGLIPASEVGTFFYVASPVNVSPQKDRESAPQSGVTFNGTRRDVLIADVIAMHGDRVPAAADSPRLHRPAFVYVISPGRPVDAGQVAKVDRIRREFENFFLQATEGRMRVETRLAR